MGNHLPAQQAMTFVRGHDGSVHCWGEEKWRGRIALAANGLFMPESIEELMRKLQVAVGDELTADELRKKVLSNALRSAKVDPAFARLAARLGLQFLYEEVLGSSIDVLSADDLRTAQRQYFPHYIAHAVSLGQLDARLQKFNLTTLSEELCLERDYPLDWSAYSLLYEEFLLRDETHALETPQIFWMRVAMGVFIEDSGRDDRRVLDLYKSLSLREFCPASTTLLYAGTKHPHLLPGYVYALQDNMEDIMSRGIAENAFASKWGAGLGGSWSSIRGKGAKIGGSRGISEGVRPFLELHRHQLTIANQGPNRRKGAGCAYLDLWHWDVEMFIELHRKPREERGGDRGSKLRICLWVPDLFMERLGEKDAQWTLFQPNDVPDLLQLHGDDFRWRYLHYETLAEEERISSKRVPVRQLWQKILAFAFETGFPALAFCDTFNRQHCLGGQYVIHASSLFGEMAMALGYGETAGGAFGSISIPAHLSGSGSIDGEKFAQTVRLAVDALDAVLSVCSFPSQSIAKHCAYYRGICLGVSGLHDWLRMQNLPFDCEEAERQTDTLFELLHYEALSASNNLAQKHGPCAASEDLSVEKICKVDPSASIKWRDLQLAIRNWGLRNAYLLGCAPNGRTAKLLGTSPGALPLSRNGHIISLPDGECVWLLDEQLASVLKTRGLWSGDLGERLNHLEGDVSAFPELPDDLRRTFVTAFECSPERLLAIAATIQKHIDQSQYVPLQLRMPTFSQISALLIRAWKCGIKVIGPLLTAQALASERARANFR
jgi:ribonucleoside-diphosphate reductase alpha chain